MKRLVFGDGPPDAKICFVGEAPGATEEKLGRPFVGSAGDLLWKLAGQVGIVRHECFVTNVVKERPPNNDISVFIQFNKTGPPSCTREYMDYENSLYHELSKLKANVFVPLGNVPLWALLRRYGGNRGLGGGGITKVRGSIFQGQIPPNTGRPVKIIPSIHTAAALPDRTFMFSYMIAADLKRVKVESESPLVQLPSRKLIISPSFYETMEYIRTAQQTDMVGLDIEVMNEEISCMSLSLNPFDSMSIPFTHGGREYFTIEQEIAIMREIAILLSDPTKSIVGQNHIGFDLAFLLRRYRIICRRKVEDVMVAQGIAYPDLPKGLDFTTSIYTREPYYKDEGKKWFKFGGSEEDFRIYNAKDSAVLPEILPIIRGELNRQGNLYHYEQQCLLQGPLSYMHERGMRVDNEGLRQAVIDSENEIAPLVKRFHEICGKPINPNSPAQLCRYFYQDKGIKPYVNRKTKAPTTDETALKRLARRGFEEAGILLKIRSINKLKGTYYEMQMDRDGRLRCSFNPVGTVSTRLSSSKTIFGTGGNTQNLPDAFLKFVLADEDNMFYSFDLEQAENRIVAYIAPEPNMIEAFEQGKDLHRRTASPIFGKHEDLISDVPGSASIGGGTHSERFWGKKSNHELNYDMGYKTFALICEISDREGKLIWDQFHAMYPGVHQYHAWIREKLAKNGRMLENLLGLRRVFLGKWGDELFKEAYSWTPQSSVAQIINHRGLNHIYYNQDIYRPVDLLNQVHDSIVLQMSVKQFTFAQHADCVMRIRESLEQPLTWAGREFVIPVGLKVGLSLDVEKERKVKLREFSSAEELGRRLCELYRDLRGTGVV